MTTRPRSGPSPPCRTTTCRWTRSSTIPARLDLLAATGATTTRVDLFWGDIAPSKPADPTNPADPAYDFSRADLIMLGLAKRGITPIVSVYNTPAWASADPPSPGRVNTATPDPAAYGEFMAALATRYSGTFTSPGGEKLPEVRHFEIWNEPNLSAFLAPQFENEPPGRRLDAYAAMDRAAYPAIKEANSEARGHRRGRRAAQQHQPVGDRRHGVAAGPARPRHPARRLLPARLPGAPRRSPTRRWCPSWATIGRLLDELDAWKPGLPLYITEAGYTTAATQYRDTKVTEEQQAEYLSQIYSLPQLRTERVKAVVWFNLQDNANWPAGLLREDLSQEAELRELHAGGRGPERRPPGRLTPRPGVPARLHATRSRAVPRAAATIEPARMPILEAAIVPGSVKASSVMNSETVNPIPARAPIPTMWLQVTPRGRLLSPSVTAMNDAQGEARSSCPRPGRGRPRP